MEKTLGTLEAFEQEAMGFARGLRPRADGATLVTLSGELGAGKTAFTKAAAKAFGIEEIVNSPTFVLEKVYALPEGSAFKKLVHIDAYRLEEGASLAALGFDELMQEPSTVVFFEWPERVTDALPKPAVAISILINQTGARVVMYG